MKAKVKIYIADMGSLEFIASNSPMESMLENILWNINSARDHDGLRHITKLPKDSIQLYEPITEEAL